MFRAFVVGVALIYAPLTTLAQTARPQDSVDPKAPAPRASYQSAFEGYRPYVDPESAPWRQVNDEVGRLKGHVGHAPKPPAGAVKPAAKPTAPSGHGAHK